MVKTNKTPNKSVVQKYTRLMNPHFANNLIFNIHEYTDIDN